MKVVISGLGVMGASMSIAMKQNISDIIIYGYDTPQIMNEACSKLIIDKKALNWPEDCKDADLIILATPLRVIKEHLKQLADIVGSETVVTDVGSTKAELYRFVREINFSGIYVGGHPMTGAEKSGISAANPLLYENAIYILTGVKPEDEPLLKKKLFPVLEAIKARTLVLDPETHDKILAVISHLPQLTAIALVNLVGGKNGSDLPYFELASGGFRDLTRIASSSIDIWQDIINSNKNNIYQALDELIALLQKQKNNLENLKEEFNTANRRRSQLPKTNKGFLSPLTDVLVYVNDQVGVISQISNALSEKDIDIRDIELLKIREKEGGVFRLSFADIQKAKEAVSILNSINYKAFIRE